MSTPDPNARIAEIERSIANVDAIGAAATDRDGAFTVMAKGLVSGMNTLLDMVKGKRTPPPEPKPDEKDDEEDEDDDKNGDPGDEDEDNKGDAGGGGGFADMRMGQGDPEMVDATQYILSLEKAVRDQRGEIAGLTQLVKRQGAQIDRLDGRLTELGTGLAATLAPLSKGMLDMHSAIAKLPAGGASTPGLDGNRAAVRHAVVVATASGATDSERKQLEPKLLKAVNARIINDQDLTIWRRTGRLRDEDAENDALIAKIKAL